MSMLTPAELAAHLRVSERTVTRMVQDGCPSLLVGSRRRFELEAVKAWAEQRAGAGLPRPPSAVGSGVNREAVNAFTSAYKRAKLRVMPGDSRR